MFLVYFSIAFVLCHFVKKFSLALRCIRGGGGGCEEMIEFYIAVVIVIVLSQALQIHRSFFFVKC